jgi:MoxR-like ATPase
MALLGEINKLRERVASHIIGQTEVVDRLIIGLLADGNLLLEGLPGLAKTRAVKGLSNALDAKMNRIQFTPDLLPSDITGTEVYHATEKGGSFTFQEGPIFCNIVLADEINRAPAKVQAALLEAMEERQVTVGGKTRKMPELFTVLATQNPIEQEGTYPLPEAQMDRFLMHVRIDYPDEESETDIMRLVRGEEQKSQVESTQPIDQSVIFDARKEIHENVKMQQNVERYIVDLIFATRYPERYGDRLQGFIDVGASPRGTISLDRCARVHAWLNERDYVTPDDVRSVIHSVLRHRVTLSFKANAEGISADNTIDELLDLVAVS